MGKSETAWQAFCNFAKDPNYYKDPREAWEIADTLKPPKKQTRKRKMTLGRAMKQANKAGVAVNGATITADGGVKLELGEASQIEVNPWDHVQ
jgi:hypothetical protein